MSNTEIDDEMPEASKKLSEQFTPEQLTAPEADSPACAEHNGGPSIQPSAFL